MPSLSNIAALFKKPPEQPEAAAAPSVEQDRTGIRLMVQKLHLQDSEQEGQPRPPLKSAENTMTEKTISTTLDKVGVIEGGYVNHPNDPGGETNHGVTLRFLQSVRPGATSKDLKALTKEDARAMFDEHFVRRPGFDQLPDVVQAEAVALGINAGVPTAIRVLQRAAGVEQDGHLGPETLAAVKKVDNATIKNAVDDYYRRIVKKNPKLGVFLKGWLKRSASINAIPHDDSEEEESVDVLQGDDGKLYIETAEGLKEFNG